jgi:uroporphyrinogen decarboxylase
MTARERILTSISHREPDLVPLDLGATPSTGISAVAYGRLKRHMGISGGHNRVYDVVQQVAQPEDSILDHFGVDVVDIGRAFNTADCDWYDITLSDGSAAQYPAWFHPVQQENGDFEVFRDGAKIARMPVGATFFDQTYFPYLDDYPDSYEGLDREMGMVLWQSMAHSPWDNAGMPDFYGELRSRALRLREHTDKALMIVCGCNLFEWGTFLRRIDNFLMDIYSEPDEVERLLDELMVRHLTSLEKVCAAVGDVVDILRFGDDLGMDSNPFMSPEKYRSIFKPRHKTLCDYVHKHSGMKTFLHSCGSIYALLPDLIDAGYDIINPVQTSARDMDPARLKKEFGGDITFWGGGCNTRGILNHAAPQEVYDYTMRMLDIFLPGGGYVFNQEHNILPDVPPQNIMAMYRAVGDYGGNRKGDLLWNERREVPV